MQLDAVDKMILSLLTENARMPLKQIAAQVYLSSPAVAARIRKLELEGVITGYHATVARDKLESGITAFVQLVLPPECHKRFAAFLEETDCVLECYHVTGPYSMLIKARFPDTAALDEFVEQIHVFGKTNTQIVFSQT